MFGTYTLHACSYQIEIIRPPAVYCWLTWSSDVVKTHNSEIRLIFQHF